MSVIKVAWYVTRVKDMHLGSTSDPSQTAATQGEAELRKSILKPHGQSSRSQVRPLLRKAKLSYVYSILKQHGQSSRSLVGPLLHVAKPELSTSDLKST